MNNKIVLTVFSVMFVAKFIFAEDFTQEFLLSNLKYDLQKLEIEEEILDEAVKKFTLKPAAIVSLVGFTLAFCMANKIDESSGYRRSFYGTVFCCSFCLAMGSILGALSIYDKRGNKAQLTKKIQLLQQRIESIEIQRQSMC